MRSDFAHPTGLNSLTAALVAAGFFALAAAVLYGLAALQVERGFLAAIVLGCMTLGVFIHLAAWMLLGRMRE